MSIITDLFETVLKATAEKSIGPTVTARNLFITSSVLYNTQTFYDAGFVPEDGFPRGSYGTGLRYTLSNRIPLYTYVVEIYLNAVHQDLFKNANAITDFFYTSPYFIDKTYMAFLHAASNASLLLDIRQKMLAYLAARNKDGWLGASVPVPFPNGTQVIEPNAVINFAGYADPLKWTPIRTLTYLTPRWGDVRGVIPDEKRDELAAFTQEFLNGVTDFEGEVRRVFEQSLALGDREKAIAEFWAGAPRTITPPGFWNMFLIAYHKQKYVDIDVMTRNFMTLNKGLFQASILAWRLKGTNLQARPIQTIRYFFPGQTITYYGGVDVSSSLWKPYQPNSFMTPPFPDFISGHSTFSAVGARILGRLLGNNLIDLDLYVNGDFMPLASSLFANGKVEDKVYIHCLTIFPRTSSVNAADPVKAVTLTYNTWDDMALEAGLSRIYGGIHYDCSNYAGYLLGNKIGDLFV